MQQENAELMNIMSVMSSGFWLTVPHNYNTSQIQTNSNMSQKALLLYLVDPDLQPYFSSTKGKK